MGLIPDSLKGKRRYWFCHFCGGTRNWLDRQSPDPCKCRKCGMPIGVAKIKPLAEGEKEAIRERDERTCLNCGKRIGAHRNQHVHHLRARHFGGTNEPTNLATLCVDCHRKFTPGWREALDAYRAGDQSAFKEWEKEKAYQLRQYTPKMRERMLIIYGRVLERERQRRKNG